MEMRKISRRRCRRRRRRPRSLDGTELGRFTLLFCRRRQRNVQNFDPCACAYACVASENQA